MVLGVEAIILIVGFGTLLVERGFAWLNKIRTSKCLGGEVIFHTPQQKRDENSK